MSDPTKPRIKGVAREQLRRLSAAIVAGDVAAVRAYLDGRGDPDASESGTTLLMEACYWKQPGVARLLVERGASINVRNDDHLSPLTFALEYPEASPRPIARDPAVVRELVTLLLDRGAEVNPKKLEPLTRGAQLAFAPPLTRAAELGDVALVSLLLERGADIHGTDYRGYPALVEAVNEGHTAVVARLLEAGAAVNPESPPRAGRPLAQAVSMRASELSMFVFDARSANKEPDAARLAALERNAVALVTLLLDRGASLEARDERGWTPLVEALNGGSALLTRLLVERGASLEWRDKKNNSVLHFLADVRRLDEAAILPLLDVLPPRQVDRAARNADGQTAAQLASKRGFARVAARLAP